MTPRCPVCDQAFGRSDHLERHLLRHDGARPFSCGICGAGFARRQPADCPRDALLRHTRAHAQPASASSRHGSRPRRACVPKACRPCADSKQKCDGQEPCSRCVARQRPCVYTANQRRTAQRLGAPSLLPAATSSTERQHEAVHPVSDEPSDLIEAIDHFPELSSADTLDQVAPQPGATDLGECNLTDRPLSSADWADALAGAMNFIADGNDNLVGNHALAFASQPSPQAPRPLFTTKQGSNTLTSNEQNAPRRWSAPYTADLQNVDSLTWDTEDYQHVPALSQQIYDVISLHFTTLNADNGFHKAFTDELFPSYKVITAFVQDYFEHFQPIFPMLHQPTFDPRKAPWILTLAVAVTGSRYSVFGINKTSSYLIEFLRRAISLWNARELADDPSSRLGLDQATVLSQIVLMFCADLGMAEQAQMNMSVVALISKKAGCHSNHQDESTDWKSWVFAESHRRLAYFSWCFKLVDSQLAMYFDIPPTLAIDLLYTTMPSSESLWAADSEDTWMSEFMAAYASPLKTNLRQALDSLYDSQQPPSPCDELTRLLLTVGVYFDKQQDSNTKDYLDMLRRDEGQIAATERLGWVTLEHNHILSLILHLPLRELFAFSGWHVNEAERCEADARLAGWVRNERSRARLVIYHAAKLYSSIREHPLRAYSETMSFLAATLAIWAVMTSGDPGSVEQSWLTGGTDDEQFLNHPGHVKTLRFDRATDRTIVARWVSGKATVRPYLAGVGALEDSMVAPLLIRESLRVLRVKLSGAFSDAVSGVLQSHFESKSWPSCSL